HDIHGLNGFLLLLHIGSGPGRRDKFHARFGQLLDYLSAKGYQFVGLDELLDTGEIFIRANQLGYLPDEPKVALAFSKAKLPDSFTVVPVEEGKPAFGVYEGKLHRLTNSSWGQFENHAELDFSKLNIPGNYFLKIGDSKSLPFSIGEDIFVALPDRLLGFMRQQRCGYNPWLDAVCHPF